MEYRGGVDAVSPHKNFRQHVLTLLSGTVVAQLLPIITLPLLARLFPPEAFGIFATCTAASTLLSVVATCRYELAIVMAKDHQEASEVFSLVVVLSSIAAVLLLILGVGLCLSGVAPTLLKTHPYDALAAVGASWLVAINQASLLWFNREARYKRMAFAAVFQQVAAALVRVVIGVGAIALSLNGLFFGTIVGVAVSVGLLLRALHMDTQRPRLVFSRSRLLQVALKFRNFPIFNMPYSLLGTFSRDLLLYLLTGFGHVASAGFFGFARSCISIPITFLSTSLGQVYFQRISTRLGSPEVEALTFTIMTKIRIVCLPLFAGLFVWGPEVFALIFGEQWRTAGYYAALFAPATFLYLFSSWPERIFEVSGKQSLALKIQVFSDGIATFVLWLVVSRGEDPAVAVATYSAVSSIYHMLYIHGLFRAAGFQLSYLWKFLSGSLLAALVWSCIFYLVKHLTVDHVLLGILTSGVVVFAYLWLKRASLLDVSFMAVESDPVPVG
jgi:O-antigen/teichoic acid export membrane protein